MRQVEFDAAVEIDGEEVDVTVRAEFEPPIQPMIRAEPDDCDFGDVGSLNVLSVTRNDTHEDVTHKVDHNQFYNAAVVQVEYDCEAAYLDEMEARADAAREREWG